MDALVAILAFGFLVYSFRKIGWWRWFWLGLAGYLAIFELTAKLVTGKTISQQFWAYMAANPTEGWIALVVLLILAFGLAIHLAWKWIKRHR